MSLANMPRNLIIYLILTAFSFFIGAASLIYIKSEYKYNYPIVQLNNTASICLSGYIKDR